MPAFIMEGLQSRSLAEVTPYVFPSDPVSWVITYSWLFCGGKHTALLSYGLSHVHSACFAFAFKVTKTPSPWPCPSYFLTWRNRVNCRRLMISDRKASCNSMIWQWIFFFFFRSVWDFLSVLTGWYPNSLFYPCQCIFICCIWKEGISLSFVKFVFIMFLMRGEKTNKWNNSSQQKCQVVHVNSRKIVF